MLRKLVDGNLKKALIKSVTWRVISTSTSFVIAFLIFGSWRLAGGYAALDAVVKFALYYLHELGWQGKLKGNKPETPY